MRRAALGLALVIAAVPAVAFAADAPFRIERAGFEHVDTLLVLNLEIDGELPGYIALAIDEGFAVPFMFEVEIRARERYWLDPRVVSLKQSYLLHYQPLLDAFVVIDRNRSQRHYFDSRKAAVRFTEVVYNYPMLDINNLTPDREYYARVRYGIDSEALPQPLKSSSFWDNDWDLQSDWYEWEVVRPES